MAYIKTSIRGLKKVNAKFADITLKGDKRNKFTEAVVNKGYEYARKHGPWYSGSTLSPQSLQVIKGHKYTSLVLRGKANPRDKRNYHMWMHGLGGKNIASHIKSGDPDFMFGARDRMRKLAKQEYRKAAKLNKGL